MNNDCPTNQPTKAWYSYNGIGSLDQPSSYGLTSIKPTCRMGSILGAIYAPYGGQFPAVISSNLNTYISNGIMNGMPQPDNIGAKRYVYLRQV